MIRYLILGFCSFALTGCASTIDYKKSLQEATTCCSKLSDIEYRKLEYGKAIEKKLGSESDKARVFEEGKSFYMPVKLPPYEGPFEIQIQSRPVNNQIFIPRISLLDENHKLIKQVLSSSFVFNNGKANHKFFVNNDQGYRYMVLYTAPSDVGKKGKQVSANLDLVPIIAGPYIFYYHHASENKNTVTSSEGGIVQVKALKYEPRVISQQD